MPDWLEQIKGGDWVYVVYGLGTISRVKVSKVTPKQIALALGHPDTRFWRKNGEEISGRAKILKPTQGVKDTWDLYHLKKQIIVKVDKVNLDNLPTLREVAKILGIGSEKDA